MCLGFRTPEQIKGYYEEYIIRYMMGKDDQEGYATVQSDVPEGTGLWIIRRDKASLRMPQKLSIRSPVRESMSAQIRRQQPYWGTTPRRN